MPFNLQVIQTSDFVRLNGKGEFDFPATRQLLGDIAKTCVERGINCALMDIRRAQSAMSLSDLYKLAAVFKEMGFRKNQRLAILHRYRAGERAEFFATCAADAGWNVRAFEEYEEAMDWFATTTPAA